MYKHSLFSHRQRASDTYLQTVQLLHLIHTQSLYLYENIKEQKEQLILSNILSLTEQLEDAIKNNQKTNVLYTELMAVSLALSSNIPEDYYMPSTPGMLFYYIAIFFGNMAGLVLWVPNTPNPGGSPGCAIFCIPFILSSTLCTILGCIMEGLSPLLGSLYEDISIVMLQNNIQKLHECLIKIDSNNTAELPSEPEEMDDTPSVHLI